MDPLQLLRRAHDLEASYLATLETLVARESPTHHKAACDALAGHLQGLLRSLGWNPERIAKNEVGDQLIGRRRGGEGPSSLLLCHYDTVWPLGTLEQMPFRRDGDLAYGPGSCDMKAGIATALHAVKLLDDAGLDLAGDVTLLLTSDEETGSHHSRDIIEAEARGHDRVLVLEPSSDDGRIKIGRKGVGEARVRFSGRSAHAGNNPDEGASALRELAHFLFYVEDLNDPDAGTTANLTVARGGSVGNVIAETAEATVDLRVLEMAEAERVETALAAYRPRDSRVEVVVEGGINRPPLEPTDANKALWKEARRLLDAMGLELDTVVSGGGSDGNFTSALGIPTLDGLGCSGVGPHARHEHIGVKGTLERVALIAGLLGGGR